MGNVSKIGILVITLCSLLFTACSTNYMVKELNSKKDYFIGVGFTSLPLGIIVGGVIGLNIGYKYTYHFNQ